MNIFIITLKILFTLLVAIMCRFFIIDLIKYIKQKDYSKICLGVIIICSYIYYEIKVLFL